MDYSKKRKSYYTDIKVEGETKSSSSEESDSEDEELKETDENDDKEDDSAQDSDEDVRDEKNSESESYEEDEDRSKFKKKQKLMENKDNEYSALEEFESEEVEEEEEQEYEDSVEIMDKEVLPTSNAIMKAAEFRRKLNTSDGVAAIRIFFQQKTNLDHISEYLKEGGSVSELVAQLSLIEIRKGLAVDIFSAMSSVTLKSLKEYPERVNDLAEECKNFITNYIQQLIPMLSQKTALNRKKTVLKLLTAIVSVNDALAIQILSFLDLKKDLIFYLAEHNNPVDETSIRVLFVKFVLSFIVGHSAGVINRLCDKIYWIPSLFPGMKYDLFVTVDLILTVLQGWLISRKDITKKSKLYVFNSKSLTNLAYLYNWNPKSWKETVKDKKISIPSTDPWALSEIRAKVHQLLLNVCTSLKTGVIFKDPKYGTTQQTTNSLVQQFILNFPQAWDDNLKSELLYKILITCPDLIKTYCNAIAPSLKLPTSTKWINIMKLLTKVIQDVEVNESFLDQKIWLKMIYNVYAPEVLLQAIDNERLLTGTSESRIVSLLTLKVIINKLNLIKSYIRKTVIKNIFNTNISHYLIKNAPSAEIILGCLQITFKDGNIECGTIIMDLILSLHSLFPQLLDIIRFNKDCLKLIQSRKDFCKKKELNQENCLMILKLTKLEILLNPLVGSKNGYKNQLEDIFTLADNKGDECKILGVDMLKEILESTGLFVHAPFELSLWLHLFSSELKPDIGSLLSSALKYANKERYNICNTILWAQDNASEAVEAGQISLDDFINLSLNEEEGGEEKLAEDCNGNEEKTYNSNLDLSPLLPAMLHIVSQTTEKKLGYNLLVVFMIHYLHTQVSVKAYNSLLTKYKCYPVEKIQHYIEAWNREPKILKFLPFAETIFSKISNYILLKSEEEPLELINLDDKESVELCLNQCIFTICQLSSIGQASDENINRTINIIKYLMPSITNLPLNHPQLINYFHPIRTLDGDSSLTPLVISIIEHSSIVIRDSFISPYIDRLFFELKYAKKNKNKLQHCTNIQKLLLLFPLTKDHVQKLVGVTFTMKPKYFSENNEPTPWVHIVEHLLKKSSEFDIIIPEECLVKLCEIIFELNRSDFNLSILCKELHNYLVKNDTEIAGAIFDNFKELFVNLCTNKLWYEGLCIFLMNTMGEDLKELPQDIAVDRAVILIASVNIYRKTYEHLLSSYYSELLILFTKEPIPSWFQHLANIIELIMSNDTCDKFCKDINKLSDQIVISKDSLLVLKEIFNKSGENKLFLHLLNQWLILSSQKSDYIQSEEICRTFLEVTRNIEDMPEFQKLDEDIIKYLILYGMRIPSSIMLDYVAFCIKTSSFHSSPSDIIELIWSHTKFVSLFVETGPVKVSLLLLIKGLFCLDKSLIKDTYVPLFLSAYNATLKESDQIILQVLQLFESYGVNMNVYRPYIWGEAAVEHYSTKKRNPRSKKVHPYLTLDHFNMDLIKNTITNFPIYRKLEGICKVDCDEVYDPAFVLPVLYQILSPESDIKINPWKVFHCGAMALILASLASHCIGIRIAACLIMKKIRAFFNKKKDALIWYHFVNAVRLGMKEISQNNKDKIPRISCIASTFLARSSLIIGDPTHFLYKQINNFVLARLEMNLKSVPALLEIFHSSEEGSRLHQQWIIEVLRDGLREPSDIQIAFNCFAFKFMLDFHSCSLANKEIKVLIEELVAKCLQSADKDRQFLMNNYSLIPWLESSGKSTIILEQLPHKLISQYKPLIKYVCRDMQKKESDESTNV